MMMTTLQRALYILITAVLTLTHPTLLSANSKDVAVKVNGAAITEGDVEAEIDLLIPRATFHGAVSEETRRSFRDKAIENAIDQELRYQDAVARGMKPDAKKVVEYVKKTKAKFRTDEAYREALKSAGVTEEEFKQKVGKVMLIEDVVKKVSTAQKVTDADVKDYYTKNPEKFKKPESVRLSLVSSKSQDKAREMLALIKSGEDFGSVAARMSEDNYRIKGGDIGYIHRGRVFKEIEDVAFILKKGEVSELIKSSDTWFVIRIEDRQAAYQQTFDEVKEKLKKDLQKKQSQELTDSWLAGLKAKATVQVQEAAAK